MADLEIVGNPLTLRQRIADELRRKTDDDLDLISKAIVSAVRHYRAYEFFFNTGTFTMDLTAGTFEYGKRSGPSATDGIPEDLIEPITIRLKQSTFELQMMPKPIEYLRNRRFSTTYQGYPWAYAWFNQQLHVIPAAHADSLLTIEGDYIKDVGTPTYTYANGEYTFYETDGGSEWDATQTSPWYGEAEELIRARAKKDLLINVLDDSDAAVVQEALEREAFRQLKRRSQQFSKLRRPTPWN